MSPGQSKSRIPILRPPYSGLGRYIVINKNGSANELEASSRNYNPLAIFNDMKYAEYCSLHLSTFSSDDALRLQSNLAHLETHIRV